MNVGATLPQFQPEPEPVFDAVHRAEELGLDGVFLFDHLWPIGRPDRPAWPSTVLLGAIASETTTLRVGTLVSRVGLRPDAVLVHEVETAAAVAPERIIVGLGTGDRLSAAENRAFGLAYPPSAERIEAVARCARAVLERGIEVWVGGRSSAIRDVATQTGATLNLWDVPVEVVAEAADAGLRVTWGGPIPAGIGTADHLRALQQAGAAWAVVGWPASLDELAAAVP